jgi:DNA gyrase subunit A
VHEIPETGKTAKGRALVNLVELEKDEKVKAMLTTDSFPMTRNVIMVTKKGIINKTILSAFGNIRSKGIYAIKLMEGDELIDAKITDGENDIIIASAGGMASRFNETLVRPTGRNTKGMRGMKLRENDSVVAMVVVKRGGTILAVSENGFGKRTAVEDYTATKGRNTRGVITLKTTERNGKLVSLMEVIDSDDLMIVTRNGIVIRQNVGALRVQGRNTQGVKLINIMTDDAVHDITCIHDEEEVLSDEVIEATEKRKEFAESVNNDDGMELNTQTEEEEE